MSIIRNAHEPIIEQQIWEYIQRKREQQKKYRQAGKQTLFSGFLRCGGCGSNMHFHFNQKNPTIEYFNCSNYVGNRGTCPDTHYVRVDYLAPRVLSELNQLIHFAQHQWEIFSATVEQTATASAKDQVTSLTKKHQVFQSRMKELKTLLTRLYEDKIKGVVDLCYCQASLRENVSRFKGKCSAYRSRRKRAIAFCTGYPFSRKRSISRN